MYNAWPVFHVRKTTNPLIVTVVAILLHIGALRAHIRLVQAST
jgi:hypothetical protein